MSAGESVPFVHSHKQNEEIYVILAGSGKVVVDGEDIELNVGDCVRIAPEGKRQFFAAQNSELDYLCIQVKAGSLENYTMTDGVVY
jgi:mannose-6-phosphate isomerase-like protein (cupin superfamily)